MATETQDCGFICRWVEPYGFVPETDCPIHDTPIGRRVEWASQILAPREYAKLPDGTWYAATPNGRIANLAAHQVTEHEDGTITVAPSILVKNQDREQWHGFLERGVWRSC